MKRSFFTLLFLPVFLLTVTHTTQGQQAEKTLVKAFNVKGQQFVLMDVEGIVQVTTWNQELMQIQMTVSLINGTETILKSLVTSGRYNLESDEAEGKIVVTAPGLARQVKLGSGSELKEIINYHVFAPENVSVMLKNAEADTGYAEGKTVSF